jgi:hypothetical protein
MVVMMMMMMMIIIRISVELWWSEIGRESPTCFEENLSHASLSTRNSTWTGLGSNLSLLKILASNCLSQARPLL